MQIVFLTLSNNCWDFDYFYAFIEIVRVLHWIYIHNVLNSAILHICVYIQHSILYFIYYLQNIYISIFLTFTDTYCSIFLWVFHLQNTDISLIFLLSKISIWTIFHWFFCFQKYQFRQYFIDFFAFKNINLDHISSIFLLSKISIWTIFHWFVCFQKY